MFSYVKNLKHMCNILLDKEFSCRIAWSWRCRHYNPSKRR